MMSLGEEVKNFFFWLSGAGREALKECPDWEQQKYVTLGVLVLAD